MTTFTDRERIRELNSILTAISIVTKRLLQQVLTLEQELGADNTVTQPAQSTARGKSKRGARQSG